MMEGLAAGEEDEGDHNDNEGNHAPSNGHQNGENGEDPKENLNGASLPPSITERPPAFHPRKKQALRNTFGFIAPGDIPVSDDAGGAPAAPAKLRVAPEPVSCPREDAGVVAASKEPPHKQPAPASPLPRSPPSALGRSPLASGGSPTSSPPSSPLRGQQPLPPVAARSIVRPPPPSSSPSRPPAPSSSAILRTPSPPPLVPSPSSSSSSSFSSASPSLSPASSSPASPSAASPSSPSPPLAAPPSLSDSNSGPTRRPVPGGGMPSPSAASGSSISPGPSRPPMTPLSGGRAPIPSQRTLPAPTTTPAAGLSPPALPPIDPAISSPSLPPFPFPSPSPSTPAPAHATLSGSGTLNFARPPPPNRAGSGGVNRSSPSVPPRGSPPALVPRTPGTTGSSSSVPVYATVRAAMGSSSSSSVPIHATLRAQPPTPPPRHGSPAGSVAATPAPPASASVTASILSPRLGSSPSLSSSGSVGAASRESDHFLETVGKKETISVHCSIESKEKYVVGSDVAIKLRIINDSSKTIRHINAALAKSTAAERQKDDKRREKNKGLPKFEDSEEMISFISTKFPLEKGLFDGTLNYKIPPCKEGPYSNFKVELVVELALKKSVIYAFLPINLC